MGQGDEHSDQGTQTWQILSVTFNRATIKTQKKKKKKIVQTFKHDQNHQTATDCHNTDVVTGLSNIFPN